MTAGPVEEAARGAEEAFAGTPGEDLAQLVRRIESGDWATATLDAVGATVALARGRADPAGALATVGVGWALEHVRPLSDLVDELTGDPDAVVASAAQLRVLGAELVEVAADLRRDAARTLDGQYGRTVAACDQALHRTAVQVDRAASSLSALAGALQQASVLVEAVRTFVTGLLAEILGRLVERGLLFLTPVSGAAVAGELVWDVTSAVRRARRVVHALLGCLDVLRTYLRQLVHEVTDIAATALRRQGRPAPRRRGEPAETIGGRLARLTVPSAAAATSKAQTREEENRSAAT